MPIGWLYGTNPTYQGNHIITIDWWFTQKSLGCWGGGVAPELAPRVPPRDKRRETGGSDSTGAEGCGWTDWHLQGSSESWPKKWEKHGLLMTEYSDSHMRSLCVFINTYKYIVIGNICLCINQFFMIINTKTCVYIILLYIYIYIRIYIYIICILFLKSIFQHILLF